MSAILFLSFSFDSAWMQEAAPNAQTITRSMGSIRHYRTLYQGAGRLRTI